eukprot:g5245.t1
MMWFLVLLCISQVSSSREQKCGDYDFSAEDSIFSYESETTIGRRVVRSLSCELVVACRCGSEDGTWYLDAHIRKVKVKSAGQNEEDKILARELSHPKWTSFLQHADGSIVPIETQGRHSKVENLKVLKMVKDFRKNLLIEVFSVANNLPPGEEVVRVPMLKEENASFSNFQNEGATQDIQPTSVRYEATTATVQRRIAEWGRLSESMIDQRSKPHLHRTVNSTIMLTVPPTGMDRPSLPNTVVIHDVVAVDPQITVSLQSRTIEGLTKDNSNFKVETRARLTLLGMQNSFSSSINEKIKHLKTKMKTATELEDFDTVLRIAEELKDIRVESQTNEKSLSQITCSVQELHSFHDYEEGTAFLEVGNQFHGLSKNGKTKFHLKKIRRHSQMIQSSKSFRFQHMLKKSRHTLKSDRKKRSEVCNLDESYKKLKIRQIPVAEGDAASGSNPESGSGSDHELYSLADDNGKTILNKCLSIKGEKQSPVQCIEYIKSRKALCETLLDEGCMSYESFPTEDEVGWKEATEFERRKYLKIPRCGEPCSASLEIAKEDLASDSSEQKEEKNYLKEKCESLAQCTFESKDEHYDCFDACDAVNSEKDSKKRKQKCLDLADPENTQSIAKPCVWVRGSYVPFGEPGYCKVSTEVISPTSMMMRLLAKLKHFFASSKARVKSLLGFKDNITEADDDCNNADTQRQNSQGDEIRTNFLIALGDKIISAVLNFDASNLIQFLYSANVICEHFIEGRAHLKGSAFIVKFDPSGRLSEPFRQLKALIEKVIGIVKGVNDLLTQLYGILISAEGTQADQIKYAKEVRESCLDVVDYSYVEILCEQYEGPDKGCTGKCEWNDTENICSKKGNVDLSEDIEKEKSPSCSRMHGTEDVTALRKIAKFEMSLQKENRKKVSVGHIFITDHRNSSGNDTEGPSSSQVAEKEITCISPQSSASMPLTPHVVRGESYFLPKKVDLKTFCDSNKSETENECNIISMQSTTKDNRCLIFPDVKASISELKSNIIEEFNIGKGEEGQSDCFQACTGNDRCRSAVVDESKIGAGTCYLMSRNLKAVDKEYELNIRNWFYAECVTVAEVNNGLGALQRKNESCLKNNKCFVKNGECLIQAKALWDDELVSDMAGKMIIIQNERATAVEDCDLREILKNITISGAAAVVIASSDTSSNDELVKNVDKYTEQFTTLPHFSSKGISYFRENLVPFCFVGSGLTLKDEEFSSQKHVGLVGFRTENLEACFEKCIIRKKAMKKLLSPGGIIKVMKIIKGMKEKAEEAYVVYNDVLIPVGGKLIQSIFVDHLEEFKLFSSTWYKTLGNPKKVAVTASATASVAFDPDPEGIRKREKERKEADLLKKKEGIQYKLDEYREACSLWDETNLGLCNEDPEFTEKQMCEANGNTWINMTLSDNEETLAQDTSIMDKIDQKFREKIPSPRTVEDESVEAKIDVVSTEELLKGSQINAHADVSLDISALSSTHRALSLIWEPKLNIKKGWKTPIPRLELFGVKLSLESNPEDLLKQVGINIGTKLVLDILQSSNVSNLLAKQLLDVLTNANTKYAKWLGLSTRLTKITDPKNPDSDGDGGRDQDSTIEDISKTISTVLKHIAEAF